jgi:hypothetical protein
VELRYRTNQYKDHRYWNFVEYQKGEAWFNLEKVKGLIIPIDFVALWQSRNVQLYVLTAVSLKFHLETAENL